MLIVLSILLAILAVFAIAAAVYIHKGSHYWQRDYKKTVKAGFASKEAILPDGSVISYGEGPDNGPGLMLIHGQTGAWQDYSRVLPELSRSFHIFAVDCYGHGGSSHDEAKYYLKENGDDLIWFADNILKKQTVVSGHSSGGILAAYVAAYGGDNIIGAVLEDPPVFSTEPDYFEKSFAYQDTYKVMHKFLLEGQPECWEAYYLRNCLWGKLYMPKGTDKLADSAQKHRDKHPGEPVQLIYFPESLNATFLYSTDYDFRFGEHFYDYSWHSGIRHEDLLQDIDVPTVFMHVKAQFSDDGILMAASSDEQAAKAAVLIGSCDPVEVSGNHNIHRFNPEAFIGAVNRLKKSP